jgi:hypothetical protein
MHDDLARDVINPQNGHILCDANPATGGASDADSSEMDALMFTRRLRRRSRNLRKALSIGDHLCSFSPYADGSV